MHGLTRYSALLVGALFVVSAGYSQFSGYGGKVTIGPAKVTALPQHAPDHIVIRFKDGVTPAQANSILVKNRLTIDNSKSGQYFIVAKLNPTDVSRGVKPYNKSLAVQAENSVVWAEIDPVLTRDFIPNDTRFGELWGMHNTGQSGGLADADVDAVEAWDDPSLFSDIVVADCDDGFDLNHEDSKDNIYHNPLEIPGNSIDDDANGFVDDVKGWDFSSDDNDPSPENGDSHGVHTSGTIAATHNNGKGVSGVGMNNIKYMPLRMYGGPNNFMSALANAVDYAWQNGASVISVSYNIDGFTNALADAVGRAKLADVIYCNSAGNNGQQNPPRQQLRNLHDNVIFVAATNRNDQKASFSNWGTRIEIGAPGVDILSTVPGGYALSSGTSMSTPMVSGILGMIRSTDPTLTARQTLDLLLDSADSVATLSSFIAGGKRANLFNALTQSSTPDLEVTPAMGNYFSGDNNSIKVDDDSDYIMTATAVDKRGQYAAIDVTADLSAIDPASLTALKVTWISHTDTAVGATQFIQLYNYDTNAWEAMNTQRMYDTERTVSLNLKLANMSKYVNPVDKKVKLRGMTMRPIKRSSGVSLSFQYHVDFVEIKATHS